MSNANTDHLSQPVPLAVQYRPEREYLGRSFGQQLALSPAQVGWLNKVETTHTMFTQIEGCCLATIWVYLHIIERLDADFTEAGASMAKVVNNFVTTYIKAEAKGYEVPGGFDSNSYRMAHEKKQFYKNRSYMAAVTEQQVYLTLFKIAENAAREAYGVATKVVRTFTSGYSEPIKALFVKTFEAPATAFATAFQSSLPVPDLATEQALNAFDKTRWRPKLKAIQAAYTPENHQAYEAAMEALEQANLHNPQIEHLFFPAVKFMAPHHRPTAVKHHLKYTWYNAVNKQYELRRIATLLKKLLGGKKRQEAYDQIVTNLLQTRDMPAALQAVTDLYPAKSNRK